MTETIVISIVTVGLLGAGIAFLAKRRKPPAPHNVIRFRRFRPRPCPCVVRQHQLHMLDRQH